MTSINSPRITPAEAAEIEAGLRGAAPAGSKISAARAAAMRTAGFDEAGFKLEAASVMGVAEAVARINAIKPQVLAERKAAFDKMHPLGLSYLAQVLHLYDDGVFTAEQTIKGMRETLGIPVIADSRELGDLMQKLYQGHFHGKASEVIGRDATSDVELSAEEAQYQATGLRASFRPISFDPALVKKPALARLPGAPSAAVQVPDHTYQVADSLHACAALLADIAHQLALCAAALHPAPAGSAPAPQSGLGGLL